MEPLTISCHLCKQNKTTAAKATCCKSWICTPCWRSYLNNQLVGSIWKIEDLDSSKWMCCPVLTCQKRMGTEQLDTILKNMEALEVQTILEAYRGATSIRQLSAELQQEHAMRLLSPHASDKLSAVKLGDVNFSSLPVDTGKGISKPLRYTVRQEDSPFVGVENTKLYLQWNGTNTPTCYITDDDEKLRHCAGCLQVPTEIDPEDMLKTQLSPNIWQLCRFPTRPLSNCDHKDHFCIACYRGYLEYRLDEEGALGCDRLQCLGCSKPLIEPELRICMPKALIERLNNLQLQKYLSTELNFRWCLRSGCEAGAIYDCNDETMPQVCQQCGFQMCFYHQVSWHTGMTCEEYENSRAINETNLASTELIEQKTKPCPECRVPIKKSGGCSHMYCTHCSAQFCWWCSAAIVFPLAHDCPNRLTYERATYEDSASEDEFDYEAEVPIEAYDARGLDEGEEEDRTVDDEVDDEVDDGVDDGVDDEGDLDCDPKEDLAEQAGEDQIIFSTKHVKSWP
ncbi:hypothetical protein BT63DRAFT_450514 [Microthyrium microscopicum]|uniref:RBR-type E3 ubiquitin transferase n=1 Tax=Microthyrium microscopicum TaxID=703497 RepID=A0A6A6UWT2_9PEZI|nr:hypothetical protein BT63DRAFT_450514 [Microthyrium microscopicum]